MYVQTGFTSKSCILKPILDKTLLSYPIKINVRVSVILSPLRNFGPLGTIRMKVCIHHLAHCGGLAQSVQKLF